MGLETIFIIRNLSEDRRETLQSIVDDIRKEYMEFTFEGIDSRYHLTMDDLLDIITMYNNGTLELKS